VALFALVLAGTAALAGCGGGTPPPGGAGSAVPAGPSSAELGPSDAVLAEAYVMRAHNLQVEGRGTVVRLLADDEDGGRHQRFIVRLASGQTILVAHNIDIAARVNGLRVRDTVAFFGVYEWNEEGGTIHWTHRDPAGEHVDGWLRHGGRVYQ
jgi:hypothetical protein